MKKIIYALILLIIFSINAYAVPVNGPHLWLSTDPNNFNEGGVGYVYDSLNPWITESYVTYNNPFMMYLYNSLQNQDSPVAINIGLLVAIHSSESGIVTIKDKFGNITEISEFTYTNVNPYYGLGYHGVYQNPGKKNDPEAGDAVFAVYHPSQPINLASQESTSFKIGFSGFSEVHFDAFSTDSDYPNNPPYYVYNNPPSHDVTAIPEPATLSLLGLGLLGLFGLKRKA